MSVVLAGTQAPASAATGLVVPYHPKAVVRVVGTGWGHGVGMSQWGARGRALAGQSAAEIVAAYYAGTSLGHADTASTPIRVLINRGYRPPATDGSTPSSNQLPGEIIGQGGTWEAEGITGPLPASTRLRLAQQVGTGRLVVRVIDPAGAQIRDFELPGVLVVKPLEASTRFRVVYEPAVKDPDAEGQFLDTYRGSLILHINGEDNIDTVNVLSIENYVRGVVPAEMPSHWPAAALQAQAIAARGYALTSLRPDNPVWDLDDTPNFQAYLGVNHETESTNAAVDATAEQVVTYTGEPVRAFYFSSGNGHTESNEDVFGGNPVPYLRAVPDVDPTGRPWDADSPRGTWNTEPFALTVLGETLEAAAETSLGNIESLDFSDRTGGGQVVSIGVDSTSGSVRVRASDFARAFNRLTSPAIGEIESTSFRVVLPDLLTRPVVPLNLPDGLSRYFEESGHNVHHGFLTYFDARGGVDAFGLPLTEEFEQGGRTLQYFERARFEYYPEHAGTPYEVQLGLVGDEVTAARRPFPTTAPFQSEPDHQYFPKTRQGVHFAFLAFWLAEGGLDRFGYPTSGEFPENGHTVQYFQRARFEWHPETGEVRLGAIGSELLRQRGLLP